MQSLPDSVQKPRKLRDHRKSRGGCVRCKAKRIKCSETRPSCSHCLKTRVSCRYPLDPPDADVRPMHPPRQALSVLPFSFSHEDVRAFHRYLTVGYPPLPLGTERAWKTDVPQMSHEFSFCMHALLALGLSHVSFGESLDTNRKNEAKHRAVAMRGVNNVIARGSWTVTENDALLATLYAMMFACSYAGDSIYDFFSLARAVGITTRRFKSSPNGSLLVPGTGESYDCVVAVKEKLKPHRIDQAPVSQGLDSLASIAASEMSTTEAQLHSKLVQTLGMLMSWDTGGYFAIADALGFVASSPPEEFESLMNPANGLTVALLAHLIAIEALIAPLIMHGSDAHEGRINARACGTCVKRLYQHCPPETRPYMTWPLQFCSAQEQRFKHGLRVTPESPARPT